MKKTICIIYFYIYLTADNGIESIPFLDYLYSNQPAVEVADDALVLINGILIDGTGRPTQRRMTLIVNQGKFQAVGKSIKIKIPENIKPIDLKGKTIIPGIVGMHNHLHIPGFPFVGDVASKLYLASGVTTVQTSGAASAEKEIILSNEIETGMKIGPEIIPSAPFITGKGGNPNMMIPRSENEIRDFIKRWVNQGVKWFKVYRNTNTEDLKIILDQAKKSNAYVRGHLCSITFSDAASLGINGIEHGLNSASDFRTSKDTDVCNGGREYMDELTVNSEKVKTLLKKLIDNRVFLTSTLSIYEASIPNRSQVDRRALSIMSPILLDQYKNRRVAHDKQVKNNTRNHRFKRIMDFEYQFFKMGGILCSGVDAGLHVLPGFGDQRNFELFVEAGFTTEEAIQIMTRNGAYALERQDIGTVEVGKRADFVILNGDLTKIPSTIKQVELVFKNGHSYEPEIILSSLNGQFGLN